jgi:hypothetical protein
MNDTTTERTGTTVTLVYSPSGSNRVIKKFFKGMTEDDIVAVTAALAARRISIPELHDEDMQQLKAAREHQMLWYADRMAAAFHHNLGWWTRLLPAKVRKQFIEAQMDYLKDITATWTSELLAMHAEINRTHEQARALRLQPRPEPVAEPLIPCRCCSATFVRADFLPEGWTPDHDGYPRCPQHRVTTKDQVR